MKFDWTPSGGVVVTLADDSARVAMTLEPPLGLEDAVQEDEIAFGAAVFLAVRGNSKGQCIFTAAKSHADRATAVAYFKTQQGYRGNAGVGVLTEGATTVTMAAVLVSAMAVKIEGVRWTMRYVFRINSIT